MCLTCSMLPESYAQRAENLNLNRIVQPPYHCYGRLADGCPHAEELGWKVGVQFYTFHKYTFFEAIDLTRALGLHYIEATIGARICEESTQNIHAGLSPEWRERIKRKLAESGVKCESIYYWMDGSGKGFEDIVKFCDREYYLRPDLYLCASYGGKRRGPCNNHFSGLFLHLGLKLPLRQADNSPHPCEKPRFAGLLYPAMSGTRFCRLYHAGK